MSRDRLRDLRAQQQPQYGGGGYGDAPPPPQQAYPQQSYQQPAYAPPPQAYQAPPPVQPETYQLQPLAGQSGMQAFFAEVGSIQDQIKQLHQNVTNVSELHSRRLATTDDALQSTSTKQLADVTQETSALTNAIRNQIHRLNEQNRQSAPGDPDFKTRKSQIATLQNSFRNALEEYNTVEKKSRDKYRQRMERQIRIVKPDATQEEIKAAFDNQQSGQQIFSQALVQSRQSGARAAFAEVQTRNQDLRKIEETITQLAQMMQDMATLVLEQDEQVKGIETSAVAANTDVEQGLSQTKKAVISARRARKARWACFVIILCILIVVGVVVGVEVSKNN